MEFNVLIVLVPFRDCFLRVLLNSVVLWGTMFSKRSAIFTLFSGPRQLIVNSSRRSVGLVRCFTKEKNRKNFKSLDKKWMVPNFKLFRSHLTEIWAFSNPCLTYTTRHFFDVSSLTFGALFKLRRNVIMAT